MRRMLHGLVLVATATSTVALGVGAPAHASVARCGPQHVLSSETAVLPVMVSTCGEANGALRRSVSTLVNLSNHWVPVQDLRTLISFPNYGDKDCGSVLLGPAGTPSATATCVSPWVSDQAGRATDAAVFTLIQAFTPNGQFISDISNFHAVF